jgi:hypothetical protein
VSHNITDVDAFTSPVVVPDGTDSHTVLAEYIAAIAQALANRTRNLLNGLATTNATAAALAAHAAYTDVANTFTVAPQTVNDNNANRPILTTTKTCNDDPTSPNLWKRILEFPTPDAGKWRLYTGKLGGDEQFTITMNAGWAAGAQHWSSDDTGQASIAVTFGLGSYEGMRIARRPAGAGTWTDWNFTGGGSGNLVVNNQILAGSDIVAGGDVTATNISKAGNTFDYSPAQTNAPKIVNLGHLVCTVGTYVPPAVGGGGYERILVNANGDKYRFPIELPRGAVLTELKAIIIRSGAGGISVTARKNSGFNWSSAGTPTDASIFTNNVGADIVTASGSETIDENVTYYGELAGPLRAGDEIVGVRIRFTDPGPRSN